MNKVDKSLVYRLLYPAVPVVVASCYRGNAAAMPVASLVSLSNAPPLVGFSSSSVHATYQSIRRSKAFSVTWLDRRYSRSVEFLGRSSGSEVRDKLRASGLRYRLVGAPAVPRIEGASAYLLCKLERVQAYGDHQLVVGRVHEAKASEDFEDYWAFKTYSPLLYTGLGREPLSGRPSDDAD